jgi:hypothetical protein
MRQAMALEVLIIEFLLELYGLESLVISLDVSAGE